MNDPWANDDSPLGPDSPAASPATGSVANNQTGDLPDLPLVDQDESAVSVEDSGASVSGIRIVPEAGGDLAADAATTTEPISAGRSRSRRSSDHEPAAAAQHDAFDPAELVTVCSRYDLGSVRLARPYKRGSRRSPKMVLDSEAGLVLIKRRAPRHGGAARVRFCHMIQKRLEHRDYPVARLLLTRDGATCVYYTHESAPERAYEVFEFVNGKRFDRSVEAAAEAGLALAGFHRNASDIHEAPQTEGGFTPPTSCYHGVDLVIKQLDMLGERLRDNAPRSSDDRTIAEVCAALNTAYSEAAEHVNRLGFAGWPVQIIHGDWHPGNLVFRDRQVVGVLDLDSARLTPRVIDVASGALQFSITRSGPDPKNWPAGLDEDRLDAFLRAYDGLEGCVLSNVECKAIPWLMIEAIIAEVVVPIAATGRFGAIEPSPMLRMIAEKVDWIRQRSEVVTGLLV